MAENYSNDSHFKKMSTQEKNKMLLMDWNKTSYLGWKSWLGAEEGVGLELLMMMREARNRKSSNNCWIRDGPGNAKVTHWYIAYLVLRLNFMNCSLWVQFCIYSAYKKYSPPWKN